MQATIGLIFNPLKTQLEKEKFLNHGISKLIFQLSSQELIAYES